MTFCSGMYGVACTHDGLDDSGENGKQNPRE
jgi:hypothetical protein